MAESCLELDPMECERAWERGVLPPSSSWMGAGAAGASAGGGSEAVCAVV